jgi:hypothetical protein
MGGKLESRATNGSVVNPNPRRSGIISSSALQIVGVSHAVNICKSSAVMSGGVFVMFFSASGMIIISRLTSAHYFSIYRPVWKAIIFPSHSAKEVLLTGSLSDRMRH